MNTTLRFHRFLRGESVEQTAHATRIPASWVAEIERGKPPWLSADQTKRLEAHFGRPIAELKAPVKPAALAAYYLTEKDL
jgi:transcriptional regulator with XRE-family HTH domain